MQFRERLSQFHRIFGAIDKVILPIIILDPDLIDVEEEIGCLAGHLEVLFGVIDVDESLPSFCDGGITELVDILREGRFEPMIDRALLMDLLHGFTRHTSLINIGHSLLQGIRDTREIQQRLVIILDIELTTAARAVNRRFRLFHRGCNHDCIEAHHHIVKTIPVAEILKGHGNDFALIIELGSSLIGATPELSIEQFRFLLQSDEHVLILFRDGSSQKSGLCTDESGVIAKSKKRDRVVAQALRNITKMSNTQFLILRLYLDRLEVFILNYHELDGSGSDNLGLGILVQNLLDVFFLALIDFQNDGFRMLVLISLIVLHRLLLSTILGGSGSFLGGHTHLQDQLLFVFSDFGEKLANKGILGIGGDVGHILLGDTSENHGLVLKSCLGSGFLTSGDDHRVIIHLRGDCFPFSSHLRISGRIRNYIILHLRSRLRDMNLLSLFFLLIEDLLIHNRSGSINDRGARSFLLLIGFFFLCSFQSFQRFSFQSLIQFRHNHSSFT